MNMSASDLAPDSNHTPLKPLDLGGTILEVENEVQLSWAYSIVNETVLSSKTIGVSGIRFLYNLYNLHDDRRIAFAPFFQNRMGHRNILSVDSQK